MTFATMCRIQAVGVALHLIDAIPHSSFQLCALEGLTRA